MNDNDSPPDGPPVATQQAPVPGSERGNQAPPPALAPRPTRDPPTLFRPWLLSGIVAVAFAVGTVGTPVRSVGWTTALCALSLTLVAATVQRPAALALGVAGTCFLPWLSIRMSTWLITVDLVTASALLAASVSLPRSGPLAVPVRHHAMRILTAVGRMPFGPAWLVQRVTRRTPGPAMSTVRRWASSLAIGLGALGFALAVLASGDALLASYFDVGAVFVAGGPRVFAAASGALLFAFGVGGATAHVADPAPQRSIRPAPMPTLFAIGGLATAIALYAATQASAALLGADFVKSRTGLTYAEYARGGFFQLVFIATLATTAVVVARTVTRQRQEMTARLRLAAAVLTTGVVATVVAAVVKLVVYADTFGLTMLRVYTVVFACWLGIVAVLAFAALLRPRRDWLATAVIASAVAGAFAMNVANPEHMVADHNLTRAATTGTLDVDYLSRLSADAAPVLFDRLDELDGVVTDVDDSSRQSPMNARDELLQRVCLAGDRLVANDDLSFNLARHRALERFAAYC